MHSVVQHYLSYKLILIHVKTTPCIIIGMIDMINKHQGGTTRGTTILSKQIHVEHSRE